MNELIESVYALSSFITEDAQAWNSHLKENSGQAPFGVRPKTEKKLRELMLAIEEEYPSDD